MHHPNKNQASAMLLSMDEAAAALNVSPRTVFTMKETGELPYVPIGRRVLFSRAAIEKWIEEHQVRVDPPVKVVS